MGTYIDKGNEGFRRALNGRYIDKTGLIAVVNSTLETERAFTCVTRCRRFGKTMAAKMLCAYYDRSCDSRGLFHGLEITGDQSYEKHLNRYPVITLDITDFTTRYHNDTTIVTHIQEEIKKDVIEAYPGICIDETDDLMAVLIKARAQGGEKFIMLIDEWDAILREFGNGNGVADNYINLLRRLFKGGSSEDVFAGVYMTGIFPIKKYSTQSALNNFREYSVIKPGRLASYFGFTPKEIEAIAANIGFSQDDLKTWYDGYSIGNERSIYNPYSVMEAVEEGRCGNYWSNTGAYDSVSTYIGMNHDGLKDDILFMLGGGRCYVDTTGFENDPAMIRTRYDALTVLIHLGYLAYDIDTNQCYIPNKEVYEEMEKAVVACRWGAVNDALSSSRKLLADTLDMNEAAVASAIDRAHDENTSILSYNDENSLACVLSIAYYYARNSYIMHRELATGKGFADIVLIPRRNVDTPAVVVELKCDKSADAAIDQILRKEYPAKVLEYSGDVLLVGINYDKESKTHSCSIKRFQKQDCL